MELRVKGLTKSFASHRVLDGVSFTVPAGESAVILGPSGCGKTTLLRILAGLEEEEDGELHVPGKLVSMVFQEPALLPWMSVMDNLELPLRSLMSRADRRRRAEAYLKLVGLTDYARWRPSRLSGGMRRRVSLARAFAHPSPLVLLDEPFSGLDLKLKMELLEDLRLLASRDARTLLMVTHDVREALSLGDRVIVLSQRPARVREVVENAAPGFSRRPGQPAFQERESRLYSLILDTTDGEQSW